MRRDRERPYRRALRIGLIVSFLLHLAFLIATEGVRLGMLEIEPRPDEEERPLEGLIVVGVEGEAEEQDFEAPRADVVPIRRPEETEVIDITPVETEPAAEPPEEPERVQPELDPEEDILGLSNAERLRPRMSDPRVWIDPSQLRPLLGPPGERYARADSAVRAIIGSWMDSLALDAEQRRKLTDWTFGEGDERWGIKDGMLHLGSVVIPIPLGFGMAGPQRREFEQAMRDLEEIQRQNLQDDLEQNRSEREAEMRARSEEEVASRRDSTAAADSTARPDTTARRDTTVRRDTTSVPIPDRGG